MHFSSPNDADIFMIGLIVLYCYCIFRHYLRR